MNAESYPRDSNKFFSCFLGTNAVVLNSILASGFLRLPVDLLGQGHSSRAMQCVVDLVPHLSWICPLREVFVG